MGVPGQFSSLMQIWMRCLEELKPLSRSMANKPTWGRLGSEKGLAEPVEVQPENRSTDTGEPIPPRPGPGSPLRLDEARVERLLRETRQVGHLLDEAMLEGQPEEEVPKVMPSGPANAAANGRFAGLVVRYHAVLAELGTRASWTRTDFETLVRKHSLMPSAALDVINEWSQDRFDELILEDKGDDLIVHAELVVEEA